MRAFRADNLTAGGKAGDSESQQALAGAGQPDVAAGQACPFLTGSGETAQLPTACPKDEDREKQHGDTGCPSHPHSHPHVEEDEARDLFVVGLNHRTADVELREQFFTEHVELMLGELKALGLAEVAVLFTCNRIEVYGVRVEGSAGPAVGGEAVVAYFAKRCGIDRADLAPHLYSKQGCAAAMHLLRVSAGLESLVLGESQILGQVAAAAERSIDAGSMGPALSRLFMTAVESGKRVRSETDIGRNTLSVSHAGVMLAKAQCPDFAAARVLIVGAGEMARLGIAAARSHGAGSCGAGSITLINRTDARAEQVAAEHGASWLPWSGFRRALAGADVIIAATSSQRPIIQPCDLPGDGARRHIIDLGVPRNADPSIAADPGIALHDVDDLRQVVEAHRALREQQVGRVEHILGRELERYVDRLRSHRMGPAIAALRRKIRAMASAELERALRRLPNADAVTRDAMEMLAHRIVAKVVHGPMVAMKGPESQAMAEALREMFELKDGE